MRGRRVEAEEEFVEATEEEIDEETHEVELTREEGENGREEAENGKDMVNWLYKTRIWSSEKLKSEQGAKWGVQINI